MTTASRRKTRLAAAWLLASGCIGDVELGTGEDGSGTGDGSGSSSTATSGTGDPTSSDATTEVDTTGAPITCTDGVVAGDVLLESQGDADALEGCTTITGSLTIVEDVESLLPLASLREIGGGLYIGPPADLEGPAPPPLTTLAGLEALESIGGDLSIAWLNQLESIAALSNLRVVPGDLDIAVLFPLDSLDGLQNIERVDGRLYLASLFAQDLGVLSKLGSVGGDLRIEGVLVTDLSGLEALTSIGAPGGDVEVRLEGNPVLESLAGLQNVAWHDGHAVRLLDNPVLVDLGALSSATELRDVTLVSNAALAHVDGFASLATISGQLTFSDNVALADLGGFASLTTVGGLSLTGAHAHTDLAGLDALEHAGNILVELDSLAELGPLPALQTVDELRIAGNETLMELSGLAGVTTLEQLEIEDNAALVSLSGLAGLTSISDGLRIVLNGALPQVDAEAWAMGVTVGGLTKIAGNLGSPPPGPICPWLEDGECDEDELCVEGSDQIDCMGVP